MAKPLSDFGAEFAKQRASGAKTFDFKGKKYTTEMAKPAAKAAPTKAAASYGNEGRRSPAPAQPTRSPSVNERVKASAAKIPESYGTKPASPAVKAIRNSQGASAGLVERVRGMGNPQSMSVSERLKAASGSNK